jgi:hypothetical protein
MTGTAAGSPANIQIAAGNLSKGIWSCNPDYTVNGAVKHMGDNDVYSAAVRDALAGFNYGFIASPETNPEHRETLRSRSERELVSTDRPSAKSCL